MFIKRIDPYSVWLRESLISPYPYSLGVSIDIAEINDFRYFQTVYACIKTLEDKEPYGVITFIIDMEKANGVFYSKLFHRRNGDGFFLYIDRFWNLHLDYLPKRPYDYFRI